MSSAQAGAVKMVRRAYGRRVLDEVRRGGWSVGFTGGCHLVFRAEGRTPVYTACTPSGRNTGRRLLTALRKKKGDER